MTLLVSFFRDKFSLFSGASTYRISPTIKPLFLHYTFLDCFPFISMATLSECTLFFKATQIIIIIKIKFRDKIKFKPGNEPLQKTYLLGMMRILRKVLDWQQDVVTNTKCIILSCGTQPDNIYGYQSVTQRLG